MKPLTLTLPANGQVLQDRVGTTVHCKDATGDFEITAYAGSDVVLKGTIAKGQQLKSHVAFDSLLLRDVSGAPNDLDLLAGLGGFGEFGLGTIQEIADPVTVDEIQSPIPSPTGLSTTADATVGASSASQVLAANATRVAAFVQLDPGAPGAVRVGDANVAAGRGLELQPGDTVTLETTAAIRVHNPNGSGATVHLAETSE